MRWCWLYKKLRKFSQTMDDLYADIILDHYKNPRNKGWIDSVSSQYSLRHIQEANLSCGDMFEVSFSLQDDTIVDMKWRGEGCAISTASMSILSEEVIGKKVSDVQKFTKEQVLEMLGLTSITQTREKCLLLPLQAFRSMK